MELFAQSYNYSYSYDVSSGGGGVGLVIWLTWLALMVLTIVAMWKIFEKAGYEGWKAIVPLYNAYILFEIAGMNGWMFLLMMVPFVNIVMAVVVALGLAKAFGKSTTFGIFGLFFFSFIGYLILAFGDAKYVGTGDKQTSTPEENPAS